MQAILPGTKGKSTLVVASEHLANRFKDATLPPVLATPIMILVMENAALDAIRGYLDPGEGLSVRWLTFVISRQRRLDSA